MRDFYQDILNNKTSGSVAKELVPPLLKGFSIEITTKEAAGIGVFRKFIPEGTEVYIVATPHTKPDEVISLARRLHHQGMIPVPHIAARALGSMDGLVRWLRVLNHEANVDKALIVAGGSQDNPAVLFSSSLDLVMSHVLTDNGIRDLRFAAHPEGHPLLPDSRLFEIMLEKQKTGEKFGVKTSLVTQFFFDFNAVAHWERKLIKLGINMPVKVGFHGIVGIASLIRYAHYCGVGRSLKQLKQNPSTWLKTVVLATPEKLILDLAKHCQLHPRHLFAGCHFFPFGNFERTAGWINSIRL
ncbi:methylenetetrahydrofolate reductase (NADPH) [biofilm metagenome]